jgi:hypothetical protein
MNEDEERAIIYALVVLTMLAIVCGLARVRGWYEVRV